MTDFKKKLTELFDAVEPAWRAGEVERYRKVAEFQHKTWGEQLQIDPDRNRQTNRPGDLVTFVRREDYRMTEWEEYRKAWADGKYKPDYAKAERLANEAVSLAKDGFLRKQVQKLQNACCKRKDIKLVLGELKYNGVILGYLKVECKKGDEFTLTMKVIVNCRYPNHSSNGKYHQFYQFPSRFSNITKEKVIKKSASESWMKDNF